MKIDLVEVEKAMDFLATTAEGDNALKALSDSIEALRKSLPVRLNDAEMRYVAERLMSQRSLDNWGRKLDEKNVDLASVKSTPSLFPTLTGVTKVPDELSQQLRVLNYGFNIKGSIPASRF
jgi:hypothetical protein